MTTRKTRSMTDTEQQLQQKQQQQQKQTQQQQLQLHQQPQFDVDTAAAAEAASVVPATHVSSFYSTHNPLASAHPDRRDMENSQQVANLVRSIKSAYKTKHFSIATASVCANETILSVTGLKDITLDQWTELVPIPSHMGAHLSFDRVYIHIPFHQTRKTRRVRRYLASVVFGLTLAIVLVLVLLWLKP